MKYIGYVILLFLFFHFAFACHNGDGSEQDPPDDDSADDHDNNYTVNSTEVWLDPSTGLLWERGHSDYTFPWKWADHYCQELILHGYDDWRLPTIFELRTLIRGCPYTEADGHCGVNDDCCAWECRGDEHLCDGCSENMGPNDGCYIAPQLRGECSLFWTSIWENNCEKKSDYYQPIWMIGFHDAKLRVGDSVDDLVWARCVRTP